AHVLDHVGPVTIRISLGVDRPMNSAKHGIALYNHEQQLIWALPLQEVMLEPGEYTLDHTFPMLPVRAGLYTWLVTLYDREKAEIDKWYCEPDLVVATESLQAPLDQWTGVLNLPSCFQFQTFNESRS